MKEDWAECMQHLSFKLMLTVVVTLSAISFVLDVWSVMIR